MPHKATSYTTKFANKAKRERGMSVNEAVAAAERNLSKMEDRILAEVDAQLAVIRDAVADFHRDPAAATKTIGAAADTLQLLRAQQDHARPAVWAGLRTKVEAAIKASLTKFVSASPPPAPVVPFPEGGRRA